MILVTGGAGYIGSVCVELLRARGEPVVVLDDLSRGHRAVVSGVPFYCGRVGDRDLVSHIVRVNKVDACMHFAAFASVEESVKNPALYYENNVQQGIALIDTLAKSGVHRFIFSSSCAVYGKPDIEFIAEDVPKRPESPYGWTKLMLEQVLKDYDKAHGLRSISLRYFNAAGATAMNGEDHRPETHLIPNILQAAETGGSVSVYGCDYPTRDGTAIRDYVHVADIADAHIRALTFLKITGRTDAFNLGSGEGRSVMDVINTVRTITSKNIRVRFEGPREGDPARLIAECTRVKKFLGWETKINFNDIIRSAWAWKGRHDRLRNIDAQPT